MSRASRAYAWTPARSPGAGRTSAAITPRSPRATGTPGAPAPIARSTGNTLPTTDSAFRSDWVNWCVRATVAVSASGRQAFQRTARLGPDDEVPEVHRRERRAGPELEAAH